VTLAILVIVTVLIVGLTMAMRIERASAHSHLERARAGYFAQLGVEQLVGTLHQQIADTNISWISFPGRIVSSGSGFGKLTNSVDLYSGIGNTNLTGALRPPNLNAQILQEQLPKTYLITDRSKDPADTNSGIVELPLRWIYVRQDGTTDTNESPNLTDKANPIIGRYAYWADDESSKLNYNIAWKRGAPGVPPGNPSQLNLPSLPGMTVADADAIRAAITPNNFTNVLRLFNSPYDARRLGTNLSGVINSNKFEVTHYNHDPNSTFFNEPRIVLTTQEKYAPRDVSGNILTYSNPTNTNDPANGAPYFLDILNVANSDPGLGPIDGASSIINNTNLCKTLQLLVNYLKRSDWPMTSTNSSLQSKYWPTDTSGEAIDPNRLTQFAIEIVDYVRCKESAQKVVVPLKGFYKTVGGKLTFSTEQGTQAESDLGRGLNYYTGVSRMPLINEVGVWVSDDLWTVTFKIEFYLPLNYGIDSVRLTDYSLSTQFLTRTGTPVVQFSRATTSIGINAAECSPSPDLTAGNYMVVTRMMNLHGLSSGTNPPAPIPSRPVAPDDNLQAVVSFSGSNGPLQAIPERRRMDNNTYSLWCKVDPPGTPENSIHTTEADDPRVTKFGSDLKYCTSGNNTFGMVNSIRSVGKPADVLIVPQQDTDQNGNVTDFSFYMPSPKDSSGTKNPDGLVKSPAELGYIHTGIHRTAAGAPWRTLRLQPNKYADTKQVPDWAFMDLFTVPMDVPAAATNIFKPHGTTIAGRINMNAQAQPFGNTNSVAVPMERIYPLKALFEGVTTNASGGTLTSAQAEDIARNIYAHTLATGANPGKYYGNSNAYDSQGEIIEVKGVADGGEESEETVRGIANLMSARGSVFSLYSIGQALKQTPDGRLVVNGEQRLEAIVERFLDPADNTVKFRTVYFRNLTP